MMNFHDAAIAIEAEEFNIVERKVRVNELTIESDMLCTDGQEFRLEGKGLARLCDRFEHETKVPHRYVASLTPGLRAELLRHHLSLGFEGEREVSLFARGSELIGIGKSDLVRLSSREVLDAVIAGTGTEGGELDITRLEISDQAVQMDVAIRTTSREVRRGDIVQAGVHISHSLIGEEATRIEGYLYRLKCTNGLKVRQCVGARQVPRTRRMPESHPRARELQQEQIRRMVEDSLAMINRRFEKLERLASEPMEIEDFASGWLRRSRLSPDNLMPLLRLAHIEEGAEPNAFGVMNAFTRVATHNTELPLTIRNALSRIGGLLAFGHSRMCPKCWALTAPSN